MVVKIIFSFIIISCLSVASSNSTIPNKDTNSSATTASAKEINDAINRAVSEKIATMHKEIIADQLKDSLNKNDVRDIFNDKFLNIMNSIQSEYRAAILGTNNNMTIFGILITIIALVTSFYNLFLSRSLKKEAKEILNDGEETFKIRIEKIKENSRIAIDKSEESFNNKINQIENDSRVSIQNSIYNINKINYYQNILLNYINRRLTTNLSKMDVDKAYADYAALHEKVISITSLDQETIATTLPELNIQKFEQLKRSEPMQNYLKQIREYFKDDSDLVSSIDKAIS